MDSLIIHTVLEISDVETFDYRRSLVPPRTRKRANCRRHVRCRTELSSMFSHSNVISPAVSSTPLDLVRALTLSEAIASWASARMRPRLPLDTVGSVLAFIDGEPSTTRDSSVTIALGLAIDRQVHRLVRDSMTPRGEVVDTHRLARRWLPAALDASVSKAIFGPRPSSSPIADS